MTPKQKTFLLSSFIKSQFSCCALFWMFCLQKALHRLNNIHERSLRLTHQDYVSNFVIFLVNANENSAHQKCLEFLMTEVYKYLNDLVMSGWFLLASAVVQYQRKKKLLN